MQNTQNNRNLATGLILAVIVFSCLSQTWAQSPWERLPGDGSTTDFESVFFIDANTGWIAAEDGKILHTTDGGSAWEAQTVATSRDLESIFFVDTNRGWTVGDSGNIFHTNNGGTSWNLQTSGTPKDLKSVFFIDATTGWAAGDAAAILKTTDGGGQWAVISGIVFLDFNSIFFADASNGWAVGWNGTIIRTADGGATWTNQILPDDFSGRFNSVFFVDVNNGWAVGDDIIIRTSDGGTTWVRQTFSPFSDLNSVFANDANNAWAVGTNGRIFRTTNGGSQWLFEEIDTPTALESVFFVGLKGWTVGVKGVILLRPASPVTPTVLVANFLNGDTNFFKSHVYLWNPSAIAGEVTVHAFSLPPRSGFDQSTATPLSLGTLGARSALTIKVVEDVLIPLGVAPPYAADSGNLTLEFTIRAPGVRGAAQVFNNSLTLAFGTYPLRDIPATSAGSPTVLVANYMNGNTAAFTSDVYLFNPTTSAGNVTVRVFTLPTKDVSAQELTPEPLPLGSLAARSALNVKLAEDILTPLGIPTPYVANGGNLTLEFTIQAADVRGAGQVFDNSLALAFGTYTLQEIPATLSGSPTVLVANYMNGNTDFFKSRVYLWNPSASAGDVTVRVFSVPPKDGMPEELTTEPFGLGSLGPESALTVKVAEDILDSLAAITTPYVANGGNLTLEFTIQAAGVRGAAQVFNNSLSLAFGTYSLQEIPATPSGSPTVLVANYMNGNTDFFKSRVYLFNPSANAGDVTVRVFSLPPKDGMPEELASSFSLGSLAARSALTVKVAEDILGPVGISLPYSDHGGNLTLEFTIQATDVRGATQVFDNALTLAFGTYTLQVIE